MNFFDIITRLFSIVPDAFKAAHDVAEVVKTTRLINPDDATLWHCVTYRVDPAQARFGIGYCTVCQKEIPSGLANQLCSEAVRRRNADVG